jgi:hypothetical protein
VRLTDIMSAMDLAVYPEVGLVIFLGVFAAVAVSVCGRGRRQEFERFASMALEPETESDKGTT